MDVQASHAHRLKARLSQSGTFRIFVLDLGLAPPAGGFLEDFFSVLVNAVCPGYQRFGTRILNRLLTVCKSSISSGLEIGGERSSVGTVLKKLEKRFLEPDSA